MRRSLRSPPVPRRESRTYEVSVENDVELTDEEEDPKAKKVRVVEQMIEMGMKGGLPEEELGSIG